MNKRLYTTTAPSIILEIDELSFGARITLFNIAHLQKMDWTISQGLLMKKGGVSERSLNRYLNELEENNLIKRETKYLQGNKGKKTDIVINWEEIFKYTTEEDWYFPKKKEDNKNTPSSNAINNIEGGNFRYTQEELDFYEKFDIKPITDA